MRLAILSAVLFISGISALIFETLWLRLSGLAFGNSIWAAALILSSFMAGLALGTAIAAWSKLQRVRPLKFYITLEIAVALFGCTIVFALPIIGQLLRPLFQTLWDHQTILLGLRVLMSFILLLIPTTAMGLTLPVMLEDPLLAGHHFRRAIGLLYGFNTLGAVCGALLGEFWLIKLFGLWGTSLAAGVLNCVAAAIAWSLARGTLAESPTEPIQTARRLRFEFSYRLPWRFLLISLGTGCILLSLEVIWFRFLRLYVASSARAFSLMLAIVLSGIGLGGVAAGVLRSIIVKRSLPIVLLLAAILTLVCYTWFPVPRLKQGEESFYLEALPQIAFISLALMFPVAFLSGFLFPSIAALVQESVSNRMNSAGLTTLFNTAGAAIGPVLAGFVLLPRLGFQTSLIACAASYAVLGFIAINRSSWSGIRGAGLIGAIAVFAATLVFFPFQRDEIHFANARKLYQGEPDQHLVKRIEGTSDTWQLLRRDLYGQPYYYRLLTNGFSMSATNPRNQRYMRLFAYLPIAFRSESQNALLIAYGCGVTADALLHDRDLRHLDIVDISKEVFGLADDYRDAGFSNPLRDPRVMPIVQDGRFFLQASPQRYDIITGEPPPPKVSGSVNLYTEQFFKLMSDRLNDGGIATFWLPIYQLNVIETKSILRAFHNAFPNTIVWSGADEEWILMGIKGTPQRADRERIQQLLDRAGTREDLANIGIEVPEELAALFLMDGEEIDRIAHDVPPLTDFFPKRLGEVGVDDKSIHDFAFDYVNAPSAARRFRTSRLIQQIWPDKIGTSLESFFIIRDMRYRARTSKTNWLAELDIHLRGSRLQDPVLEVLDTNQRRVSLAQEKADNLQPLPNDVLSDLTAGALAQRNYTRAIELLEQKRSQRIADRNEICLLTYIYCLNGNVEKAEAVANDTPDPSTAFVKWLWGKLQAEYGFTPPLVHP